MRIAVSITAILLLPVLIAVAFLVRSDRDHTQAAPLHGAIFTTTPDGTIVNENVHYNQKIEVYLDGGPGPNAPQNAAGLPDGDYVFQVTDPSGAVLLSEDAAVCRVLRVDGGVDGGVIVALRDNPPVGFDDHTATDPCHINDPPDPSAGTGVAGPSGRHDTNTDADHGPPAIVVQLMPFFDTPNPGGVYKAWIIPFDRYEANGGDLLEEPHDNEVCVKHNGSPANNCNGNKTVIGFERDDGFGPPRDQVKTDNFKVEELFPPEITVRKFNDLDGDGFWDPSEPEIGVDQCVDFTTGAIIACPGGWSYGFIEPADGGPIGSYPHFTPKTHVAAIPGTYNATEDILTGWVQTAAYLDGVFLGATPSVDIVVTGDSGESHEVVFGNRQPPDECPTPTPDPKGAGRDPCESEKPTPGATPPPKGDTGR